MLWQVGDWTVDNLDMLESAIPIEVTTRKANTQRMRNAFGLGLDAGRGRHEPRQPLPRVRHLHIV